MTPSPMLSGFKLMRLASSSERRMRIGEDDAIGGPAPSCLLAPPVHGAASPPESRLGHSTCRDGSIHSSSQAPTLSAPRRLALVALMVLAIGSLDLAACATAPPEGDPAPSRMPTHQWGVITRREIVADGYEDMSVSELVQRVDPGMLMDHGVPGLSTSGVVVFVDNSPFSLSALGQLQAGAVESIRYLSAVDAETMFGEQAGGHAALVIQTRHD